MRQRPKNLSFSSVLGHLRGVASSWVFHLLLAALLIIAVFLYPPEIFSGDTDTARNYLNTIVSSLSTILALAISIILVAIQLAASNYTHRVLDFYVRLPYNASLFLLYLVTIMHSFVLMAKIRDPLRDPLPKALVPEMSADLVLVIICFVSMLVYMYAVVQLLKPERIIHLVIRDYQRACRKCNWHAALDNIEQICDIAKRAASASDSVTGMHCVEVMRDIGAELPLPRGEADPVVKVHENLVDQWVEIVGVSVKEKETGLVYAVLDALQAQGQLYIEGRFWPGAVVVIKAYRHLVFNHLLAEGQVFDIEQVAGRLYHLAFDAVSRGRRGQDFSLRTWSVIETIAESVFTSQSQVSSALVAGFLLAEQIQPTLAGLPETEQRARAITTYFELWKSFALGATRRDAARWARWWSEHVQDEELVHAGQNLALLLAEHLERQDVVNTLRYVWGWPDGSSPELPDDFRPGAAGLFDGWPVSSNSERIRDRSGVTNSVRCPS
ncbi:DUF2254 family protein [Alicyclobacillus herbarius]|uniref:DUF2254 family protein n=1 Tax=Alicyclobacillus herbarius TaxID=122960 RepID=UPI002354104F|nr:DUF2254 family protein [Alicyclobacillus herbarius]